MIGWVDMIEKFIKWMLTIFFGILFQFNNNSKNSPNLNKLIKLYQTGGFSETFSKIRIWDAPIEMIEKIVPKKGIILDLGCGDGLLANYLAIARSKNLIIGIENNLIRITEARRGLKNTKFLKGDILKNKFPSADVILLVHVLHHLPSYETQINLLEKCKHKLKNGGELIIVEINNRPILKFILTWLIDVIVFPIIFEKKIFNFNIFYRSEKEWQICLKNSGFNVKTITAHHNKPFSHFIFYCKKL